MQEPNLQGRYMVERNPWRTAAIVLLSTVTVLAGGVVFVIWSVTQFFQPAARDGLSVSQVECVMGPTPETVLVGLTVTPFDTDIREAGFTVPGTRDLSLDGAATLAGEVRLQTVHGLPALDLRNQLDGSDNSAEVPEGVSTIVVELRRAHPDMADVRLSSLRFFWGTGELGWVQEVPIELVVTADSCSTGR